MARFFVEGIEVEVNDPVFHLPIEKVDSHLDALTVYRGEHVKHKMAQRK